MNGAQCLNLAGSYQCRCAPGWSGVNCQIGKINSQKEYMKYVLIFNETFICIIKKISYKCLGWTSFGKLLFMSPSSSFSLKMDIIFTKVLHNLEFQGDFFSILMFKFCHWTFKSVKKSTIEQ